MQILRDKEKINPYNNIRKIVIPNGWKIITVAEIGDEKNSIVDGPFGSNLKTSDYDEKGEVPVISITNIEEGFSKKNLRFITKEKFKTLARSAVKPGDIIMAKIGSTYGKCCYYPSYLPVGMIPANMLKVSVSKNIYKDFAFHYFKSELFKKDLDLIVKTTAQPSFNLSSFKALKFLLPSLNEQQKIASILSKVYELIQKTDQIIEQTQRLKKGLMQRLLTKGIEHTKFKKTVLGEIPEQWKVTKLTDVCDLITDGVHFTPKYKASGVPFVSVNNMSRGKLNFSNCKFISLEDHNKLIKRCAPKKGDLLLSKVGTLGIADVIDVEFEFSIFVQLALIKPTNTKIDPIYLKNILNSSPLQKQINNFASGSTLRYIGINKINNLIISCPDIKEQQKIASILSNVGLHVQKYQEYKYKLANLKKGLMQQLLTGKIRVKV